MNIQYEVHYNILMLQHPYLKFTKIKLKLTQQFIQVHITNIHKSIAYYWIFMEWYVAKMMYWLNKPTTIITSTFTIL